MNDVKLLEAYEALDKATFTSEYNDLCNFINEKKSILSILRDAKIYINQNKDKNYIYKIYEDKNDISYAVRKLDLCKSFVDSFNKYIDTVVRYIDVLFEKRNISYSHLFILLEKFYFIISDYQTSDYNYLFDKISAICDFVLNSENNQTNIATTSLVAIQTYIRGNYYFKARKYVGYLVNSLDKMILDDGNNEFMYEAYSIVGRFYILVHDHKRAAINYMNAANKFYEYNFDDSKDFISKALKHLGILPDSFRFDINLDEIKEKYNEEILNYLNYRGIKIDPIEHTDLFLDNYDYVMDNVEKKILIEGDLHLCYQRWHLMEEEYSKLGIAWKNPKIMNPRIMFD